LFFYSGTDLSAGFEYEDPAYALQPDRHLPKPREEINDKMQI
jgi:hypothetical protein